MGTHVFEGAELIFRKRHSLPLVVAMNWLAEATAAKAAQSLQARSITYF